MGTFGRALLYGSGVAYGLLVIGLLYALKQAVVEPLIEWGWEAYEQWRYGHRSDKRMPESQGKREIVVVSDLHVDTWERSAEGQEKREQQFLAFLDAIERSSIELYINGDLLDAPPNPQDSWTGEGYSLKGSIFPKYERVLGAIGGLNNRERPVPVTVLYGNHDLAASGVQYDLAKKSDLLKIFRVPFNMAWYPNMILGVPYGPNVKLGQEEHRFYMDHGHFYDPALLLYLRDFLFSALRSDLRRAMTTVVVGTQRRSSEQHAIPQPGMVSARPVTRDQRIAHWLVRYRWRWKARRVLTDRNRSELRLGNRRLSGGLFGHTHLPDHYAYLSGGAKGMVYFNTGDWAGNTGHGTYTIITQDGIVVQHDWLQPAQRAPHHQR